MQDESNAGSGPDVWNWQAVGVSRSLWNMVKGCLRAGLGKNAILQVVRAIQGGVPDEHEKKEEEEEEEEVPTVPNIVDEAPARTMATVGMDKKDVGLIFFFSKTS